MLLPISHDQLKELLFKEKLITQADWDSSHTNAKRRRRGVEEVIIERGFVSETYLYELISSFLKVPLVNLRTTKVDETALRMIPEELARQARCVVFAKDEQRQAVKVACVDPTNQTDLALVSQALGLNMALHYTSERSFRFAMRLYNSNAKEELLKIINEYVESSKGQVLASIDLPIVKIFDIVLEYALLEQASDIHIEPLSDAVLVRFRVDGELQDKIELPLSVKDALIARIKILSNLKIDEHRVPQDGRLSFKIDEEEESARVSVIPTLYGEKLVMRLLSEEAQNFNLQNVGLSKANLETVMKNIQKTFGMILVVGPTGSGKTTTLYAVLNILNTEDVNISTIEDPIEYGIRRVNQTQVNTVAGYTFAGGLRALLRQDPDVIMIGEIRDGETAQIAVRAALTGHLVLSTLHTNNAAGAAPRILDMGVEPFLAASTINIVIAQRLVRRICIECITSFILSGNEIKGLSKEYDLHAILARLQKLGVVDKSVQHFSELTFYKGKGCSRCHHTGYLGRVGVMELLVNSHAVQQATIAHSSADKIQEIAVSEGMVTIFDDAMQKAILGVTTLEEVLRVAKD